MFNHEERVRELINGGLTPAQARREARAEREELRSLDRNQTRDARANARLGISFFRLLARMFK